MPVPRHLWGQTSSEPGRRSLYLAGIEVRAPVRARCVTRGSVTRPHYSAIGKGPVVPATEKPLSPSLRIPESVHRNLRGLVRSELLGDLNPLVGTEALSVTNFPVSRDKMP